ncbi:MAG TPA: FecR domain-containing protein [Allosphingosinicella sp.]|nr:FecR domain-containing protein [Allosphingosinicella sp.]
MRLFRTRTQIRREAARWAVRLANEASAADRAEFMRWREADPRHEAAYDRMAGIWAAAGQLSGRRLQQPAAQSGHLRLALAAMVAVAIVAALLLLIRPGWLAGARGEIAELSVASAVGEIRREQLPDGSGLTLDSGSHIEARFGAGVRRVALLEGRARFTVAHEARPFIVSAGASQIVATGTVFDVGLADGHLSVALIEGSVEVRPGASGPARRLAAGQKLELGGGAPARIRALSRGETSWPSRMLEFDDAPLAEAAALVNRYGRPQLRFAEADIGRLRVSGAYRAGDVEGFARSVALAFGLRLVAQADGSMLLTRPGRRQR